MIDNQLVLKSSELNQYLLIWSERENEELNKCLTKFPDEIKWMTEVFVLIQKFEKITQNGELSSDFRVIFDLAHMATKDIHLCFLSMLRRHTSPAYSEMRSALEAATFINAIKNDNEKGATWMKKELFDQKDKDYKQLITDGRQGLLGQDLKDKFNLASEQSHSNMFRIMLWRSSKLELDKKLITHKYSFFDEDDDWFISHMHWLISSSFLILRVFEDVFKTEKFNPVFKERLNTKYGEYINYTKNNLDRILISRKTKEK